MRGRQAEFSCAIGARPARRPDDRTRGTDDRAIARPRIDGKFISRGGAKLHLRGVTYGTFAPDGNGDEYQRPSVAGDFAAMAAAGINAVRTYTAPPAWLLDAALDHGIGVLVGLPWEQHVTFADDAKRRRSIRRRVGEGVRACAGHPAVLGYTIGNEIPAPIVRWHGARRTERFLRSLYEEAKWHDPDSLVTYVNFPSTEYLDLPFLDFLCFNVYLEQRERLQSYLYRLQNLAGERPLVLAEIGLDSLRNGEDAQAQTLAWQIETCFAGGAAGVFTFAWTDEWYRGGVAIEDWDFGLTTRDRRPKPALNAVSEAYEHVLPELHEKPLVSVIVCTHNGASTLGDCLDGLMALSYPNCEVIVIDDGSTDGSAEIAARYGVRVLSTPNRGLAVARNIGLAEARGSIIAYVDDDARPDPDWVWFLLAEFARGHCAVGGPNIAPSGDGLVADSVTRSPGGPIHVLTSDSEAEHIPGCNMAIRADALRAIGGFDPQFKAAGDDVDVCWRLHEAGGTIGFAPAAFVWHRRRNSVRAYWRQQRGYGKAEALLERKWPERYNSAGHIRWSGRLYGPGVALPLLGRRRRIYHGSWGTGLFQSVYEPAPGTLSALPLMPEWYLVVAALGLLSALGAIWDPFLLALPALGGSLAIVLAGAAKSARLACLRAAGTGRGWPASGLLALTTLLHLIQPLARLSGRVAHGLSPWRVRATASMRTPARRVFTVWSETWAGQEDRLRAIELALLHRGAFVRRGGDFDRWDLQVGVGAMNTVRAQMAIEEHGQGKQLIRLRCWPHPSRAAAVTAGLSAVAAAGLGAEGHTWLAFAFAILAGLLLLRNVLECAMATGVLAECFEEPPEPAKVWSIADPVGEQQEVGAAA